MRYSYHIKPYTLIFRQPAGTSRGVYHDRKVWFAHFSDNQTGVTGVGECAPLPRLSCDDRADYEAVLGEACQECVTNGVVDYERFAAFPSIIFGLETALLSLRRRSLHLFDTPFSRGEEGIPINGLVWMGSYAEMEGRIEEKLEQGFRCIKLKIGAIDWQSELSLLKMIRRRFGRNELELRVDANGAFAPDEAMSKLNELAALDIHSIEQPIAAGQRKELAALCKSSPLPIALDEELIGANIPEERAQLLDEVSPQFIVIKPSLHGGIAGLRDWKRQADRRGIGLWVTSALESNVGLNAIANATAEVLGSNITFPQGLGTGSLFVNNIEFDGCRLEIDNCRLWLRNVTV